MICALIIAVFEIPGPEGMSGTGVGLAMTTAVLGWLGIHARYGRLGVGRGACARVRGVGTGEGWMGLWFVVWGLGLGGVS